MKEFFNTLWKQVHRFWFWGLCITIICSLLVLFSGIRISVGQHTLWGGWISRTITCILFFLIWGGICFLYYRAQRKKEENQEEIAEAARKRERKAQVNEEIDTLRRRMSQAIVTLRQSIFHKKHGGGRYAIPWYLVMGPKGSGKTSLLRHSELDFPLEKEEKGLSQDLVSTRSCEWVFANDAVLIDSAGSFVDQDGGNSQGVWEGFLRLLRQRRRRRPLNGIIFTLDIMALMGESMQELESRAREVRDRMRQISEGLRSQIPLYLVITHTDRVEGFADFFARLSREEKRQVVGVTFRDKQDGTQPKVVREEYDELLRRLNTQVIKRIHDERDLARRGEILKFLPAMAQLGEFLSHFIHLAFAGTRYYRATAIRGFYFTSTSKTSGTFGGTSSGTGIEVMSTAPAAMDSLSCHPGHFIQQLFESVIFPESELATLDQSHERRIRLQNASIYGTAALIVIGTGAFWINSFINNTDKQHLLRMDARDYQAKLQSLPPATDARALLPLLNTLYQATQSYQKGWQGWHTGMGLDQRSHMIPAVENQYRKMLADYFLPALARDLEDQVMANLNNHDFLAKSLAAYLMLNEKHHFDRTFFEQWMALDWSYRYSGDETAQKLLNLHLKNMLNSINVPIKLDASLVARARQQLRKEPAVNWVYKSIRNSEAAGRLPEFHFADVLSPENQVFTGADYTIPGLYTQKGYAAVFLGQGLSLVRKAISDNWVLGESTDLNDFEIRRLYSEVENHYFHDYAALWKQALNHLRIQENENMTQATDQLLAMTSGKQPLISIIQAVRKNTLFLDQNGLAKGLASSSGNQTVGLKPMGRLAAVASTGLKGALIQMENKSAVHSLEEQFRDMDMLLPDGKNNAPVLDSSLVALNNLENRLQLLLHDSDTSEASFRWATARMEGKHDELSQLESLVSRLPSPVSAWMDSLEKNNWKLLLRGARQHLDNVYQESVYPAYQQNVEPFYPFAENGRDITLDTFVSFFRKQGILDRFVSGELKPFLKDFTTHFEPRTLDGQELQISSDLLDQLELAKNIRQTFLRKADSFSARFQITPDYLDSSALGMNFRLGDTQLFYQHGPLISKTFTWDEVAKSAVVNLWPLDGDTVNGNGRYPMQLVSNGHWSLFHMLDKLHVKPVPGEGNTIRIELKKGNLQGTYLLESEYSPNLFDRQHLGQFKLPSRL